MSKKLKISQPTVINTELEPLIDSFILGYSGSLQQWYDPLNGVWLPDRATEPLGIMPQVTVIDPATKQAISPEIRYEWRVTDPYLNWNNVKIPNNYSIQAGYFILGGNTLVVRRNLTNAASGVTLRCIITYRDPRDSGRWYTAEQSCVLSVNTEVTESNPTINIQSAKTLTYNPLVATTSNFTLNAQVAWNGGTPSPNYKFIWKTLNDSGNEIDIWQKPYFVSKSGDHDETLVVNAMHGEEIPIILYMKLHESDSNPIASYDTCNIVWRVPPFDAIVTCDNGNMIKDDNATFRFRTIINIKGETLSEEKTKSEFLFKWKKRLVTARSANADESTTINDSTKEKTIGWGYEIDIPASELKNATTNQNGSSLVYSEVYLQGRYETVMSGQDPITYINPTTNQPEHLYCRT